LGLCVQQEAMHTGKLYVQSDFSFDIKPDICVYAKDSQRRGLTDIAHTELMIEFKWNASDDPFCDPYIPAGDNE
jgi:hypothetical protein